MNSTKTFKKEILSVLSEDNTPKFFQKTKSSESINYSANCILDIKLNDTFIGKKQTDHSDEYSKNFKKY